MPILEVSHVSKAFGSHKVIEDLSFSLPDHSIFGFIGQNGAGKTTTMKMILGLLKADSGRILVDGMPVRFGETRTNRIIGYLPDVPEFYGYMTSREYLKLCGQITGMSKSAIKTRTEELLSLVGLSQNTKRIQGFSRGMKQRLGIAQALLNSPRLLICDEPTSALDPLGRKEILDILSTVKEHTTILFSTHILSDVERICDQIALLHHGNIALQGNLEEIRALHPGGCLEIECCNPRSLQALATRFPESTQPGGLRLRLEKQTQRDMQTVMAYAARQELSLQRIELLEPTLEDVFMEVIHS